MADEDTRPIHTRACEVVHELEAAMKQYGVSIELLYAIGTDESTKDYFIKMFKLLQEYTA